MRRFTFVLVMLAALTSCASFKPAENKAAPPAPPPVQATSAPAEPARDAQQTGTISRAPGPGGQLPPKRVDVPALSAQALAAGTQPQQGKAARAGPSGQPYQIQVENMPIGEFVNLVFSKVLDTNYTVDKSVEAKKETVTLNMKTTARQSEILAIAREVLKGYGLDVTQKEGIYFVGPITTGQVQKPVVPYFVGTVPETVDGSEQVGLFLTVYYLKPKDITGIVTSLALSAQGKVQPVEGSMACIIDDANHARAAAELIQALDRSSLSDKKMRLFYLHNLPVGTFVGYLTEALPAQGIPLAKSPADPGMMLIPLKQIRAVLAVSLKPEWFEQVGFWQEKLDLSTIAEDEPQFFVYRARNRRASDLAKVFSGAGASRKDQKTDQQKLGTKEEAGPETMGMSQKSAAGPEGDKPSQKSSALSNVSVAVDENTNSLVIQATPLQYSKVEELLYKLDLLPRQVLVDVTIGEVTLTGSLQYGIEWAIKHNGAGATQTSGTLANAINTGLGIGSAGFIYTIVSSGGNFQAVLNAFAQDNVLKVLSTPSLVVLDNQEASIDVGTQVPVLTSQATAGIETGGTSNLLQTIQYIQTGVILTVKPTINSQGMLTLTLKQEVSEPAANTTSSISSPAISTRKIDTSVALKSGSSVLLGGLIQNQVNDTVTKVPGLGDIPLISPLFKTTSRSTTRTELFIVITPHVLTTPEEAEDATRKFRDLLDMFK